MRVHIATAYRVLYALAGFAAAAINTAIDRKIVDWDPRIAAGIAIVVGLLACVDNIRLIKYKLDARERNAARSRMHKPVISALSAITKVRDVELEHLGISVFDIHRTWVRKCKVLPSYEQRLRRILRFRLSDFPPESHVDWRRGKATIGECWQKGISVLHDRRDAALAFGDPQQATTETYASLSDDQRSGMTFDELVQTIGKYGEVLATPIRAKHSGELIGVLSIDCRSDAYTAGAAPRSAVLAGGDIDVFAQRAAVLIRDDVAKF